MCSLIILKYIFIKFNYVILTRMPHHTFGPKSGQGFSLVIVGSIKYTYETVFVKKIMDALLGKIFYISWPMSFMIIYFIVNWKVLLTLNPQIKTKVPYTNSLDQDEMPIYSASHPDPSCLNLKKHFHQKAYFLTLLCDPYYKNCMASFWILAARNFLLLTKRACADLLIGVFI